MSRGFGTAAAYHWLMNNHDDQLHMLLQQWQEIESPSNFDSQVWQRIRSNPPVSRTWTLEWWRNLLPQPALAIIAAIVIGFVVGGWTGFQSATAHSPATEQIGFLAPQTLAGSYALLSNR
jgi:anti-sigma factor RsiW